MRKRRDIDVFSLSFLDCICCGFGAIILLFILTIGPIKKKLEDNKKNVESIVTELNESYQSLKKGGASNTAKIEQILSALEDSPELGSLQQKQVFLDKQLIVAKQLLKREKEKAKSLVKAQRKIAPPMNEFAISQPVGISTESDHIVFLIDTSGSMRNVIGVMNSIVLNKIGDILNAYPLVKGIQIIDSSGNYILPYTKKKWLPDTNEMRRKLIQALAEYRYPSISDPTPGLISVFRDFRPAENPDKKIGIYIFGDEFPKTASKVLPRIDKINPHNPSTNKRPVVINAVGFPFRLSSSPQPNHTGYKFANLMRELTYEHGGSFMVANF